MKDRDWNYLVHEIKWGFSFSVIPPRDRNTIAFTYIKKKNPHRDRFLSKQATYCLEWNGLP